MGWAGSFTQNVGAMNGYIALGVEEQDQARSILKPEHRPSILGAYWTGSTSTVPVTNRNDDRHLVYVF